MENATTACGYPDHKPATGYQYGCRCDRCRAGWAEAARIRRHGEQPVRWCSTCGNKLPTYRYRHCVQCDPKRPAEPHLFTCAAPACHNLCLSQHQHARYCSDRCKQTVKNIAKLGVHNVPSSRQHWVKSQPRMGPALNDWPEYGPKLTDWPMFGPIKSTRIVGECTCRWCERTFDRAGRSASFCSETCQNLHRGTTPTECPVEYATCPDNGCGRLFAFDARRHQYACCSEHGRRILRRIRKRSDRALKRNRVHEPYTLREIAERDGWRCHLCGGKVPDQKYAARDNDPTIDHLIPQSHGGDDTKLNVALAHNRCNWERGNQGLAQLRLVG